MRESEEEHRAARRLTSGLDLAKIPRHPSAPQTKETKGGLPTGPDCGAARSAFCENFSAPKHGGDNDRTEPNPNR
eukprot:scaffold64415_cov36-Phaeocystis_antarctica.AAC.2